MDVFYADFFKEVEMEKFKNRILRAAKLDSSLYEEVEADTGAMGQAMAVVALSSIAAGIGSAIKGIGALFFGTILALVGWYIWAYLTYFIGTKLLPEPQTSSNPKELLRTIGFSSAPGLTRILGIIPPLRVIVFFIANIWMIIAMVIAVRQALDYRSTIRAVGVVFIGWFVQIILFALLIQLMGGRLPK